MLCLHMHVEVFLIILSLFANLKLMSVFTHETLLICRLGTFKNCKEVKQIMVMIIATIYIFLSENWFQKIFKASWKNPLPLFTHSLPLKIQKVQVPYLFANIENFSAPFPPTKRGGGQYEVTLSSVLFATFAICLTMKVWWKCVWSFWNVIHYRFKACVRYFLKT